MDRKDFLDCLGEDYSFHVRKVTNTIALDRGLLLDANRVEIRRYVREELTSDIIQGVLSIACQDEEVFDYPSDWWEWAKERWLPKWLKKRYPVRMARIWAIHKYPELNVPNELVGKEYIHFRVVNDEKLRKKIENPPT